MLIGLFTSDINLNNLKKVPFPRFFHYKGFVLVLLLLLGNAGGIERHSTLTLCDFKNWQVMHILKKHIVSNLPSVFTINWVQDQPLDKSKNGGKPDYLVEEACRTFKKARGTSKRHRGNKLILWRTLRTVSSKHRWGKSLRLSSKIWWGSRWAGPQVVQVCLLSC